MSDHKRVSLRADGSPQIGAQVRGVEVRPATMEDGERLLAWRNDPLTRRMSLSTEVVPWEVHQEWLERTLSAPDRHLLVGESEGEAVGQVRFDGEGGEVEISITVAPEHRGRHLAVPLIDAALRWLGGPRRVLAVIREENHASQAAFAQAGFAWADRAEVRGVVAQRWYRELPVTAEETSDGE